MTTFALPYTAILDLATDSFAVGAGVGAGLTAKTAAQVRTLLSVYTTAQVDAAFQPLDADLTSIAALATTAYGRDFLIQANAGAARTYIGAGTGSGDALVANPLSQFALTTSLQLLGVISDETGTGALVFATSPTLVTPALGTPASGLMTNATGTAAGLTAGNVTTNANLTGHVTSTGNAAILGSFTVAQLNTAISDADVATGGGTATGTNTGDQTTIVGITGTKAQFNTAVSDGDIVYLDSTDAITGVKTMSGLNVILVSSSGLTIRNPANTFKYTITAAAIAADRILTLPLIAGTIALTSDITGTNSGTNTGDQTITLTGNVTGTGTGSFATTIAAGVVTNAMLAGSIASSKLVGSDIATVGTVTSGTWSTGAVIGGATVTVGSDATGDLHYRNSGGVFTRLGIGSAAQVLTVAAGLPSWAAAAGGSSESAKSILNAAW